MYATRLLLPTLHPNQLAFSRSKDLRLACNLHCLPAARLNPKPFPSFIHFPGSMSCPSVLGHSSHTLSSDLDPEPQLSAASLDEFLLLAHKLADVAGEILMQYFRKRFDIMDKEDLSPVTIADQSAEKAMCSLISKHFPLHAVFGEEWGFAFPEAEVDFVWVLDPIDGTKSFITGKPVFGTLISLVHRGVPVIGIIDQPVLKERWVGVRGRKTLLNGERIWTRPCSTLGSAYLYTTSPHLFAGAAEEAFIRIRNKVKIPLYGCDCYAYGLLAAGHVDLVVESGLKPYDFLALVPIVEGAGGLITDWKGERLRWWPSKDGTVKGTEIIAAGDDKIHKAALDTLGWT